MSTKHTSQCLKKAGDNEPIFVIRAKDITGPATIRRWVADNGNIQPIEKLKQALELANEMEEWQALNYNQYDEQIKKRLVLMRPDILK